MRLNSKRRANTNRLRGAGAFCWVQVNGAEVSLVQRRLGRDGAAARSLDPRCQVMPRGHGRRWWSLMVLLGSPSCDLTDLLIGMIQQTNQPTVAPRFLDLLVHVGSCWFPTSFPETSVGASWSNVL